MTLKGLNLSIWSPEVHLILSNVLCHLTENQLRTQIVTELEKHHISFCLGLATTHDWNIGQAHDNNKSEILRLSRWPKSRRNSMRSLLWPWLWSAPQRKQRKRLRRLRRLREASTYNLVGYPKFCGFANGLGNFRASGKLDVNGKFAKSRITLNSFCCHQAPIKWRALDQVGANVSVNHWVRVGMDL